MVRAYPVSYPFVCIHVHVRVLLGKVEEGYRAAMPPSHPTPEQRDERVALPLDQETALRALLKVDPNSEPLPQDGRVRRARSAPEVPDENPPRER